jgi:hypothetical protein
MQSVLRNVYKTTLCLFLFISNPSEYVRICGAEQKPYNYLFGSKIALKCACVVVDNHFRFDRLKLFQRERR